jgi:hypothetical protein
MVMPTPVIPTNAPRAKPVCATTRVAAAEAVFPARARAAAVLVARAAAGANAPALRAVAARPKRVIVAAPLYQPIFDKSERGKSSTIPGMYHFSKTS